MKNAEVREKIKKIIKSNKALEGSFKLDMAIDEILEQFVTIREKETAIGFLMYHLRKSEALAQYQRDIYDRRFDEYTKHKEG